MRNNGSRRGSKKERDIIEFEGGRMTRNGLSANHLLNFSLPEREKQPLHSGRKKKSVATRTQMEYLHANYRFVIAPLTDDTAVTCWDMETLTEWKSVEQVLLWYDELSPATCPICLDAFRAPKITRCGHIFCWPCILRYLSLSDKYWRRCPMCFDSVQKGQLRSVRLESVQLPPRVEADATFQFLQRPKASLFPHLRGKDDLTLPRKRLRKIPTVYDEEAKFARILESTREYVMHLALSELRDLEALDAECRSSGDIDSLPFVEEAMKATSGRLAGYERSESTADDAAATANGYQQLEGLGPNDFYSFYQLDNGCYVVLHPFNMKCLAREFGERERKPGTDDGDGAAAAAVLQDAWTGASSPPASASTRDDAAPHAIAYERLPDVIQGRVLDIEHLVMDDEVQKRYRFLSHLPKFCDFYVCELDLSPMLSPETMKAFRADLKKREKQRKAKKEKENRGRKPDGTTSSPTSPVFRQFAMPGFSLDDGGAHWPAPAELSLAEAFHEGVQLSGSTSSDDAPTASYVTSPSFGPFTSDDDASFATITRNSGYYPPLGAVHAEPAPAPATGTWGSSSALSFSSPPLAPRGGKKKGTKGTPLFSTTQRRSYR